MKANRKFKDGEEAVSAVIGVILMVAITVAIAATVYVYVSGMMGGGTEPAPTMTFTRIDQASINKLTVVSADPTSLDWGDLELQINGVASTSNPIDGAGGTYDTGETVTAGNIIDITATVNAGSALSGTGAYTITIRHVPTNTLIGDYDFTAAT